MDELSEEDYEYFDEIDDMESGSSCGRSVLYQVSGNLLYLFGTALLCLLLRKTRQIPRIILYFLCTHFLFYQFSSDFLKIFKFYNMVTISGLLMIRVRLRANIILFFHILFLLAFQYVVGTEFMLSVRGIMMLHVMRVIALGYEMKYSRDDPCPFTIVEYLYFPAVVIFGPFISHQQFMYFQYGSRGFKKFFERLIGSIIWLNVSIISLLVSACYLDYFKGTYALLDDFLVALSFRSSHYFVSYLSQSIVTFLGIKITVTSLTAVDVPRSVLSIVSNWNQPMHTFLRKYIFSKEVFESNKLNAVLTFIVSALLHGYDPQITSTLMVLVYIGFAEVTLRKKMAESWSMCVKAKPCLANCNHKNNGKISTCINIFFRILSMYHLIFTGMPFVDEYAATGYTWSHTLDIYAKHHNLSIYISLFFIWTALIL